MYDATTHPHARQAPAAGCDAEMPARATAGQQRPKGGAIRKPSTVVLDSLNPTDREWFDEFLISIQASDDPFLMHAALETLETSGLEYIRKNEGRLRNQAEYIRSL